MDGDNHDHKNNEKKSHDIEGDETRVPYSNQPRSDNPGEESKKPYGDGHSNTSMDISGTDIEQISQQLQSNPELAKNLVPTSMKTELRQLLA